jgi:hypothetical protein
MYMWRDYTWDSPDNVPEDEINKLIDEGKSDEIAKYKKVGGFWNLILDREGYEAVAKKKEWIETIEATPRSVDMSPVPAITPPLISRKD